VCGGGRGGFNGIAAAPAAFLPPHPTAQIEARVGGAIIFLFSGMTPSVSQHRPTKVAKISLVPAENVLFSSENFRRPEADGS
jgi:hypothetical protein